MGFAPKDVGIGVEFGGPFRLAAVAFAVVGRHGCFVVPFVLGIVFT